MKECQNTYSPYEISHSDNLFERYYIELILMQEAVLYNDFEHNHWGLTLIHFSVCISFLLPLISTNLWLK